MSSSLGLRQPTLRQTLVAIQSDRVHQLGAIGLRCRITMWSDIGVGKRPVELLCLVDSGSSYSMMDLPAAERFGIPVPTAEFETELHLLTARGTAPTRVRPGRIRGWWNEERVGHPFDWPMLFRVGPLTKTPVILGLGGVLNTCRWTFDGDYSIEAPHGQLILEDTR